MFLKITYFTLSLLLATSIVEASTTETEDFQILGIKTSLPEVLQNNHSYDGRLFNDTLKTCVNQNEILEEYGFSRNEKAITYIESAIDEYGSGNREDFLHYLNLCQNAIFTFTPAMDIDTEQSSSHILLNLCDIYNFSSQPPNPLDEGNIAILIGNALARILYEEGSFYYTNQIMFLKKTLEKDLFFCLLVESVSRGALYDDYNLIDIKGIHVKQHICSIEDYKYRSDLLRLHEKTIYYFRTCFNKFALKEVIWEEEQVEPDFSPYDDSLSIDDIKYKFSTNTHNNRGDHTNLNSVWCNWHEDFKKNHGPFVLSLGAGLSSETGGIISSTNKIVVNDLSETHLGMVKNRYQSDKIILNNREFPINTDFPEESFTSIFGSHISHYLTIEEIETGFKKMIRWLKPGGRIYWQTFSETFGRLHQECRDYYREQQKNGVSWPGDLRDSAYNSFTKQEGYENFKTFCGISELRRLAQQNQLDFMVISSGKHSNHWSRYPEVKVIFQKPL